MKEQIEKMYIQALIDDLPPNVFADQVLRLFNVSGSTLLLDGWKVYKCTDCQEINVKKDNRQILVGFCDNCKHPLWNDDVD